jgi:hypothetical protein
MRRLMGHTRNRGSQGKDHPAVAHARLKVMLCTLGVVGGLAFGTASAYADIPGGGGGGEGALTPECMLGELAFSAGESVVAFREGRALIGTCLSNGSWWWTEEREAESGGGGGGEFGEFRE